MKDAKKIFLKLLKKTDLKVLVFAVAFVVMIVLTSVSLAKIHSTGGMAKAKKDAEIAYNYAVDKGNKSKTKPSDSKESSTPSSDDTQSFVSQDTDGSQSFALSEEQLDFVNDYFSTSAFVGDSVMLGFSKYCEDKGEEFLGGPLFLVAGSFSLMNALRDDEANAVLPTFKGEKMRVENALEMADNIDKVFLFFGINDFNVVQDPVEDIFENYVTLINKIKEKKNLQINIISTTYILNGKDSNNLTNENISAFNEKMKKYCEIEGYGYVNVADVTGDPTGGLKEEFCSDGFLHQTFKAYSLWANVLQNYALSD